MIKYIEELKDALKTMHVWCSSTATKYFIAVAAHKIEGNSHLVIFM